MANRPLQTNIPQIDRIQGGRDENRVNIRVPQNAIASILLQLEACQGRKSSVDLMSDLSARRGCCRPQIDLRVEAGRGENVLVEGRVLEVGDWPGVRVLHAELVARERELASQVLLSQRAYTAS